MLDVYINHFSVASRLGMNEQETFASLNSATPPTPDTKYPLIDGGSTMVASLPSEISCKNLTKTNAIAEHLLSQIAPAIENMNSMFSPERIAVIIGSSTTGIGEAIEELANKIDVGNWAEDYDFSDQELGDIAQFIQERIGSRGPTYAISTACTSSTKAIISAVRLIKSGLADAVVCGGIDTFSDLTVNGFSSLNSVSSYKCSPFGEKRDGINIGEGGALFIVSGSPSEWQITGTGETSDAYHISSPAPDGVQAERAVNQALSEANLVTKDIDLVHLHGTGTELNDLTEADIMMRLFGPQTPCVSTKGMTGHTLGAAGALQLAINLICMKNQIYPPHVLSGARDMGLPQIKLCGLQEKACNSIKNALCTSYAFGGSNAALIVSNVQ